MMEDVKKERKRKEKKQWASGPPCINLRLQLELQGLYPLKGYKREAFSQEVRLLACS